MSTLKTAPIIRPAADAVVPPVVSAADLAAQNAPVIPAVTNAPAPVIPKTETVLAAVAAPAVLGMPVTVSHRDALIARKRAMGLRRDQAETAADAQIAHDKTIVDNPVLKMSDRQKDAMLRELLELPLSSSDLAVEKAFTAFVKEYSNRR